ncbi:MAG: transcriptional regulator [Thermoprotei archaeon]|nr:MAG: transcriptional regulator [Thermoprotei archaeon]
MPIPSPEELKMLRIKAGLTQTELARRAGVSQSLIARIERGKVNPRVSTLVKIYRALEEFMSEQLVAEDVMSSPVVFVTPDTPLVTVAEIMWRKGFSQVPVMDEGRRENLGTVFEDDIIHAFLREDRRARSLTAEDIMSDPLPIVSYNTKLRVVARMLSYQTPAVLVAKKLEIVGIISKSDITKVFLMSV